MPLLFGGHLVGIGLTDLPKSGDAMVPPGRTPLNDLSVVTLFDHPNVL